VSLCLRTGLGVPPALKARKPSAREGGDDVAKPVLCPGPCPLTTHPWDFCFPSRPLRPPCPSEGRKLITVLSLYDNTVAVTTSPLSFLLRSVRRGISLYPAVLQSKGSFSSTALSPSPAANVPDNSGESNPV